MDDGIRLQSQYECWEEKVQTANDDSYSVPCLQLCWSD